MQRSHIFFVFKAIFSSFALWWALRQINFEHLYLTFKELPLFLYCAAFLLMCLCVSITGIRLYYIAQKIGLKNSFKYLHRLTWIGTFFNQLLPTGIGGDAYRIYALSKKKNDTILSSSVIIWDRIFGISCMGLLCIPMLFFTNIPMHLKIISLTVYGFLISGIVALALFIKFPFLQNYKIIKTLWRTLANGKTLFSTPFSALCTASFCPALVNFLAFYLLIVSLKIPLSFLESSVLYTISLLVTLIPLSISGWGLRESFLTAYLLACGFPPEKGFTLGILQGLLMLATGGIGAVFYLFSKNHKNSLAKTPKIDSI